MNTTPHLFVLCAGGHARVVIDILRRSGRAIAGVTDIDPALHATSIDDVPVVGGDDLILARDPAATVLVNALGNAPRTGDSRLTMRRHIFTRFKDKGFTFAQVISPDAVISARALLNEGCHVITGAIVHPGCVIGVNSIINTGAQVDHDCRIGDHSHVAPAAVLCGNVTVGSHCHIGAGAVVVQGITIGDHAIVAAGAVVVRDVAPGETIMGPAAQIHSARPRS